jgi:molybdopterin/thiamine biosynthesis adenylyltransferase
MRSSFSKKVDIRSINSRDKVREVHRNLSSQGRKALFEEFYSRQMRLKDLGRKGQLRLAQSKVAVVGLGGLGTASSLYLALAGVGSLRLIDQDTVDLENLHRQVLYRPEDVKYPKAEVAAKRLRGKNPLVKVEGVTENVNEGNVERLLKHMDCVVDGLDNLRTRYLVNRACIKLRIPYVFGAAIGVEGNLSVFAPPETPCLECVFPDVEDGQLATCEGEGVLSMTPGIIGTLQAMETVKLLAGFGENLKNRLMICDFNDMYFGMIDVFRRSDCVACNEIGRPNEAAEKVVWLCGKDTANVNPTKPWKTSVTRLSAVINERFEVKLRSSLAIVFGYKTFEVSLFNGGRMLIKNVKDEKTALRVYREIAEKLMVS